MNTKEVAIESSERSYPTKKIFIFDKRFLFKTREEAEKVLKQLRVECNAFGRVPIASLCDLVLPIPMLDLDKDVLFSFANVLYGWTDLRKAFVTYTSDGYRLILPTPIKLYQS